MTDIATLEAARERIRPHVHRTPLWRSRNFSEMTGAEVYLKAELFQKTGSYKPRGMLNKLMSLTPEQLAAGVITFSAGNAAQGLAYAARIVGSQATVVMPSAASPVKVEATRGYGAEVVLRGNAAECFEHCMELSRERGFTFVSSYDDRDLMIGHASLGLEILEDLPDVDAIFVAIGGGGMMGGVCLATGSKAEGPRLIGVEPEGAPAMYRSFREGRAVKLPGVDTIADGLAAPSAGEQCFGLARERVERVLLVPDQAIREAMLMLMTRCKLFAEPAGAAALAGLLSGQAEISAGAKVCCVVSGGNLDVARLKGML